MNILEPASEVKGTAHQEFPAADIDFWLLWQYHQETFFNKCLQMMNGDVDEAEDALSTAMLHAREKFCQFAPFIHHFKAWALRLTENLCIDWLRKRKKQVTWDERLETDQAKHLMNSSGNGNGNGNGIEWEPESEFAGEAVALESAEQRWEREEILDHMYGLVKRMPLRLREPAILRLFMNMAHHDIAVKLHLTDEAVRKRVHQARTILDRELKKLMGELPFSFPFPTLENQVGESTLWQQIKEDAEKILHHREPEIKYEFIATQIVRVPLPSGMVRVKPIFLTHKPFRQEVKVKTLQQYIARYPGGWRKRQELAEILYAMGQWDQAVKEFNRVVQKHPQHLPASMLLGQMLMQMEQEEKAMQVYKRAISFVNNESSKYYLSGMMELCRHQVDRALTAFAKAAELEPWNELFQRTVALAHLEDHRPTEALQAFETALSINPQDLVSLTHSIELLELTGRPEKAETYINRVLEIYPGDILALKHQVEYHCRKGLVRGDPGKKTRRLLRQLKQLNPHIPMVHEAEAVYHFYRGEWGKTLLLLKKAVHETDMSNDNRYIYSRWLYRTGNFQEAARVVLKVHRDWQPAKKRNDAAMHLAAAEILSHAGMTPKLKSMINHMLKEFSGHWQVCSFVGVMLALHFKEMQRASELTQEAVELQPALPEVYFNHARVLTLAGKHGQAFEILKKGWEMLSADDYCSHTVAGAWQMAQCCQKLGNLTNARHWLQRTVDAAGQLQRYDPAQGYYWQGKAFLALGDRQSGSAAFHNALENNLSYPGRQDAQFLTTRLQEYR